MIKTKIKLIIIDLYGMISHGSYKDTARWIGRKYGFDEDFVYKILYHKYFEKAVVGKITERAAFYKTCQELGLRETWSQLRRIHLSFQRLNYQVINLCRRLQEQGFTVVILSKNTPSQFRFLLKKFGLRKMFANIINTYNLGLPKSSPETIRYLMKRFRVSAKEIIMADDQVFNLPAARRLGVKTILYKNFPDFKKRLFSYLR